MVKEKEQGKEKECVRKCSHCGNNGHNLRTCNGNGCLKLFGVKIVKSFSMGNLQSCNNAQQHSPDAGYLSDGPPIQSKIGNASSDKKKGVPWSEEEHRTFLVGLDKLGKGDWRGISKKFVHSRTPTQVASHAQKYFLRRSSSQNKKRRSSLFDMPLKEPASPPQVSSLLPLNSTAEISPGASSTSQVFPLKQTAEISGQCSIQAQVANPLLSYPMECPQVLAGAPNCEIRGIPCMVGVSGNGQGFAAAKMIQTLSLVPTMNFPRPSFIYVPRSHGNFVTCTPVSSPPPSGISAPQSLPHSSSQADLVNSSTDNLELKISQPQNSQGAAELSPRTPGAIRVI